MMGTRVNRSGGQRASAFACTCALSFACIAAVARPGLAGDFEAIAGWEGDTHRQGYGFVTLGARAPAGKHFEVPIRLSGSYLYYRDDSHGADLAVRAPGVSALAGVRALGSRGAVAALGGVEIRREHRDAESPESPERNDTKSGGVAQVEADVGVAPRWRVLVLGNYAGAARYAYGRTALRWQAGNLDWQGPRTVFAGLEGVGQGNDESHAWQTGAFAEGVVVPRRVSVSVHAGYKESWSPGAAHDRGGYVGAGLYHEF